MRGLGAIPCMGPGAAKKAPAGAAAFEALRARNRKPLRTVFRKVWCPVVGCHGHEDETRCGS